MRFFKKAISVLLTAALVLPVTLNTTAVSAKELTAQQLVTNMQKSASKMKNYEATMKMDLVMSVDGISLDMNADYKITSFNDPMKMKMVMTMDMGLLGSQTVTSYSQQKDNTLYTYDSIDGSTWTKTSQKVPTVSNRTTNLSAYKKLKVAKRNVMVNKQSTTLVSASISGKSLDQILSGMGGSLDSSLGETGIDSDAFSNMKDIPVKMWIDDKTYMPAKMWIDMTDMMQSVMSSTSDELGASVNIPTCTMTITYKNINNAKDFSIPKAALKTTNTANIESIQKAA